MRERQKLPWPPDREFRILSIDGGGIKGILPAKILANLESELNSSKGIASHFDMIAGTSTGGIIAVGLGMDVRAQKILELYINRGHQIFKPIGAYPEWLRKLLSLKNKTFKAPHSDRALDHALSQIIGGRKFGESVCRHVIPAFDHNTEPCVFKTPHHPDYKMDWKKDARVVCRATSAAPGHLGGFEDAGTYLWDGGLYANNPVMMALSDVLACFDVPRRNIRIVSLGCATTPPELSKKYLKGGLIRWRNAHAVGSSLQSHDALGQAGLIIGRDRLLRIDADLPYEVAMDDYQTAKAKLPDVADELWLRFREQLLEIAEHERQPYKPVYGPNA